MKLIYTKNGISYSNDLKKELSTPFPSQSNSPHNLFNNQPSSNPKFLQVQQTSKSSNQFRMRFLKQQRENIQSFHNELNLISSISRLKVPDTNQIQSRVQFQNSIKMKEKVAKENVEFQSEYHFAETQNSKYSIAKHHQQSLRLRTGEWFQWKNLQFSAEIVEQLSKRLKTKQSVTQIDTHRHQKIIQKQKERTQEQNELSQKLKQKLKYTDSQKKVIFDLEYDDYWKQIKEQDKQLTIIQSEQDKAKEREKKRLNIYVQKKFWEQQQINEKLKKLSFEKFSSVKLKRNEPYFDM